MAFNLFKKKEPKFKPATEKKAEQVSSAATMAAPANVSVLKSFYVSEKSTQGQAYNHYTFVVSPKATKTDVKHAVQRTYKVNVINVRMVRLPAKKRTIGRWQGSTAGIKKAIVELKDGQTIAQAQP